MMKLFLPALLTIALLPLHAQQPLTTPPFRNFPGLPPNMNLSTDPFLGLRSEAPFRAVVEKKEVTPGNFSITLKSATSTRSFNQTPPSADALKVLKHLVVGREYEFPKVFDDVLGKQSATAAPSSPAQTWQSTLNFSGSPIAVVDLPTVAPFRARVVAKKVSDALVSVELRATDGRNFTVQQEGQLKMPEARRIASLLREGELYEFPHDVRTPEAGKKPSGTGEAITPSLELKALEGLIGEWEMPMQTDPDRKVIMTYVWKKDGSGIWREIRGEPPSDTKKVEGAWLITYDAKRGCYVEVPSRTAVSPREAEMRWDSETRTLTSRASMDYPEPGTVQTSTRRLVAEDRMEWHFKSMSPEGRPFGENTGHYTRVRR